MADSPLPLLKWVYAIYLDTTSLKGVASMKLHRELGITQKTAWFMQQRIREAFAEQGDAVIMGGPAEDDETAVGGIRKNMSNAKLRELRGTGRGSVGKAIMVGVKDRETKQVRAEVVDNTDSGTLQGFVVRHESGGATVYTDDAAAYAGLPFKHETVRHSGGEYVNGIAHTNGIESFWSMFKRAHKGTFHKISQKHLQRYINEFAGRHNIRDMNTICQMKYVAAAMFDKRLTYAQLAEDNGLASAARS